MFKSLDYPQNCNFGAPQGPVNKSPHLHGASHCLATPASDPQRFGQSSEPKSHENCQVGVKPPKKNWPNPGGLLAPAESKSALSNWKMAKRFFGGTMPVPRGYNLIPGHWLPSGPNVNIHCRCEIMAANSNLEWHET